MDHDIGIIDYFRDLNGKLVRRIFSQNGQRVSPIRFQHEAGRTWQQAYRRTTGYSGKSSGEMLTTRAGSPEAYLDCSWLGNESTRRVITSDIAANYAAQAGDVTTYKAGEIMQSSALLELQRKIEVARGMAKDINSKLVPVLEESARRMVSANANRALAIDEHRKHWARISRILENSLDDPIGADRELRQLTGGKGLMEVAADARDVIANYGKFLGH